MIRTIGLSAVLVLAGVAAAAPASAAPAAKKKTELTLSYVAEAGFAAAVVLRCDPAGGAAPQEGQGVRGAGQGRRRPGQAQAHRRNVHDGVRADHRRDHRQVAGARRSTGHEYGNPCEMHRATGVVLAF